MKGIKKLFLISFVILVLVFITEAVLYMEKERVRAETYALRDEIIVLKLHNRELKIEIEKLTNVASVKKWAEKNGFTVHWAGSETE